MVFSLLFIGCVIAQAGQYNPQISEQNVIEKSGSSYSWGTYSPFIYFGFRESGSSEYMARCYRWYDVSAIPANEAVAVQLKVSWATVKNDRNHRINMWLNIFPSYRSISSATQLNYEYLSSGYTLYTSGGEYEYTDNSITYSSNSILNEDVKTACDSSDNKFGVSCMLVSPPSGCVWGLDDTTVSSVSVPIFQVTTYSAPSLSSPNDGVTIGYRDNVSFSWSNKNLSSGLGYHLQISKSSSFSSPTDYWLGNTTSYTVTSLGSSLGLGTGTYYWRVRVGQSKTSNNVSSWSSSRRFYIEAPTISTPSLPSGKVGVYYTTTLSASGGKTPYYWSVASGNLPPGLSLNSSSGTISGTPTGSGGTYNLSIGVNGDDNLSSTKNFSLAIDPPDTAPTITSPSTLPVATVGVYYSTTLTANGGTTPYTWAISQGAFPRNLSLNSGGVVSGTPTGEDLLKTVRVRVTGYNGLSSEKDLSLSVNLANVTVLLDPQGGSVSPMSVSGSPGQQVTLPTPTRTGHSFGGWWTGVSGTGSQANSPYTLPSNSLTLYAKWTPITYTVTYNGNGNTGGTTANSGHTYDVSRALTVNGYIRMGHTFAGWATSSGGTVAYSDGQSVVNLASTQGATVTLYAKWTPISASPVFEYEDWQTVREGVPYTTAPIILQGEPSTMVWSFTEGVQVPLGMTIDSATGIVTWPNPQPAGLTINLCVTAENEWGREIDAWELTVTSGGDPFGVPVTYATTPMTVLISPILIGATPGNSDVVAALVNGELRAKANVLISGDNYFANLTVQVAENNEPIVFKYYDASEDKVLTGDTMVSASQGGSAGTPQEPVSVTFGAIIQRLSLVHGWNHISFNLRPDDAACDSVFSGISDVLLKVIGGNKNYTPDWGVLNTLNQIEDGIGYWVKVASACTLTVSGTALDPALTAIPLSTGWNNVAYIGLEELSVDEALTSIIPNVEKVIGNSKNYTPGWGILNTLTTMSPGIGYWIKVSSPVELRYGGELGLSARRVTASSTIMPLEISGWVPVQPDPVATPHTLLISAKKGGQPADAEDILGVFVGDQCRGVATALVLNGITYYNATVLMGTAGEVAIFKLYDASADTIRISSYAQALTPGMSSGTPENPVQIDFAVTQTYVATFDASGGMPATTNITQTYDANYVLPTPNPIRTGYTFGGWTNSAGAAVTETTKYQTVGDTTLFAKWAANAFSVRFNKNNAEAAGTMADQAFTYDQPQALTANAFLRSGQRFVGWGTVANGPVVYADRQVVSNLTAMADGIVNLYAQWVDNTVVLFDAQGGVEPVPASIAVTNGFPYGTLAVTTREGYTFGGWYTQVNGQGDAVESMTIVSEAHPRTLYAKWMPNVYTATFLHNNGTPDSDDIPQTYDASYVLPEEIPVPQTGYYFTGWWSAPDGGEEVTSDSVVKITADTIFYGQWTNLYRVVFDAQGGTVSPDGKDVNYGAPYGELPTSARDGYGFNGWWTGEGGSGVRVSADSVVTITAKQTLYADWTNLPVQVTFDPAMGYVDPEVAVVFYDLPYGPLPVPTRTGYTFTNWLLTVEGAVSAVTDETVVSLWTNHVLVAGWSNNVYMLTFDPDGGTVSPTAKLIVYDLPYGELPRPRMTGFASRGWTNSLGETITAQMTVNVTNDFTVYPKWEVSYEVPVALDPQGGYVSPTGLVYETGEQTFYTELPVPVRNGFRFAGWYASWTNNAQVVTNGTEFLLWDVHTLYAKWLGEHPPSEGTLNVVTNVDGTASLQYATNRLNGVLMLDRMPNTENGAPVVTIGASGFFQQAGLTDLQLGIFVTEIGTRGFAYCSSLTNVFLQRPVNYVTGAPDTLTIGNGAFMYCTSLRQVVFPAGLVRIGAQAFDGCLNLSRLYFDGDIANPATLIASANAFRGVALANGGVLEIYYRDGSVSNAFATIQATLLAGGITLGYRPLGVDDDVYELAAAGIATLPPVVLRGAYSSAVAFPVRQVAVRFTAQNTLGRTSTQVMANLLSKKQVTVLYWPQLDGEATVLMPLNVIDNGDGSGTAIVEVPAFESSGFFKIKVK